MVRVPRWSFCSVDEHFDTTRSGIALFTVGRFSMVLWQKERGAHSTPRKHPSVIARKRRRGPRKRPFPHIQLMCPLYTTSTYLRNFFATYIIWTCVWLHPVVSEPLYIHIQLRYDRQIMLCEKTFIIQATIVRVVY